MRAMLLAAVPLLLGCGIGAPEVELVATPLSEEEWEAWSHAGVRSAHHEITVRRTMRTPDPCRDLEAQVVRAASEVTLRVTARPWEEGCGRAEEGRFGYLAVIRGLRPGRYDLRVVHAHADPRRPARVVLRHPVLVE